MDNLPSLLQVLVITIPVIIAITLHEAAHGWVAWKLGDDTAQKLGRVSFNPIKHVDFFGTILVPGLLLLSGAKFLFGWAKPVPVDPRRLNNPRRDMVLVAAAGPGMNLTLAFISGLLLTLVGTGDVGGSNFLPRILSTSIYINALLAVFNMIPMPPLDGGRVAVGLLPERAAYALASMERWGLFVILGLLILVPYVTRQMGDEINIFTWAILPAIIFVVELVLDITGAVWVSPWQ